MFVNYSNKHEFAQNIEYKEYLTVHIHLIEETNDLSTNLLALGLLVVHNSHGGGQDDMTELTAGEKIVGPHLNFVDLDIEAGRDASALVQTTVEVNHDLSGAVVINHGDIVDVT